MNGISPLTRGRRLASASASTAALLLAWGCAGHQPPRTLVPPRPPAGYDHLVDDLARADTSGLAGRRIVLDPGHGGYFKGALGIHGLTEAEVNLDVALRLRDRLVNAGALVLLTRDRDRDFLTPADSTLRSDLAERVRLAAQFMPDLFVSIHHNADAGGRHDVNETQTYYRLGDEGPSLDVAQDVHRSLVRNVGIATQKVAPGNYYVLRNSEAPAILTETSYITNPDVEERLRLPEKRELEAEALFLGLARYFARPVPQVQEFTALDPDRVGAADVPGAADVSAPVPGANRDGRDSTSAAALARDSTGFAGRVELRARIAGAYDYADLEVDGLPVTAVRTGEQLSWIAPWPLAQGPHRATLRVRLAGVGSARERALAFTVRRAPASLALSTLPARIPAEGGAVGVRVEVRDLAGMPVLDSLVVRVSIAAPAVAPKLSRNATRARRAAARAHAPARHGLDTLITARDGVAWAYVWLPARATTVHAALELRAAAPSHARRGGDSAPAIVATRALPVGPSMWTGWVRAMPGDSTLASAPGTREPTPQWSWIDRDGFAALTRDLAGVPRTPALPGYREWARADGAPALVAIAGGALIGHRIALDAEGGGDQPAGVGPGGTRAATLNLEVARALAALLTQAGAQVVLTRDGDLPLADLERVQNAEVFHAERFLRIAHRAEPPRIRYYVGSAAGKRWAEHVARGLALMGIAVPPASEDASVVLQQPSCPALEASLARVDRAQDERRLLAPGSLRAEAWALMLALAAEWGDAGAWSSDSVIVRDGAGQPQAGVPVTLGGAFVVETDSLGVARFARTEPGPMPAETLHPRIHTRRVLLESEHGIVLTGSH